MLAMSAVGTGVSSALVRAPFVLAMVRQPADRQT
jgi:hypothetical protein